MHKDHIKLNQADQDFLMTSTSKGQLPARVFKRATALLELHRGQSLCSVSRTLQVSYQTVAQWRDNYHERGLKALEDKPRNGRPIEGPGDLPFQIREDIEEDEDDNEEEENGKVYLPRC